MKSKLLALVLATSFVLTACGGETSTTEEVKEEPATVEETETTEPEVTEEVTEESESTEEVAEEASTDYEVTEVALDESGYTPAVTGILKNTSGSEMNYVQIEFPVKDADGNKIGTAIANVSGLKDGETWKFSAASLSTEEGQVIDLENYEVTGF